MTSKGYPDVIIYLDDFLISAHSKEECQRAVQVLMETVRKLGFSINYNKVAGPSQRLTFLGIVLNTVNMTTEQPGEKCEIKDRLHHVHQKRKIKRRELQSVVGKLSWASQCVQGGELLFGGLYTIARLKSPWHRTRATQNMREDLEWWSQFLDVFNGLTPMVDSRLYSILGRKEASLQFQEKQGQSTTFIESVTRHPVL